MAKHIFFDMDGTLLDTGYSIEQGLRHAANVTGFALPLEFIEDRARYVGPPMPQYVKHMGLPDFTEEKQQTFIAAAREFIGSAGRELVTPYPGMLDLLARLHAAGKAVYICTCKLETEAVYLAKRFGVEGVLSGVFGMVPPDRLDKFTVLGYALGKLGLRPGECCMVGDREGDLFAGRRWGTETVGVAFGYARPGELEGAQPTFLARNAEELWEVLHG